MKRRVHGHLRRLTRKDRVRKAEHRERTGSLTGREKLAVKRTLKRLPRRFNA